MMALKPNANDGNRMSSPTAVKDAAVNLSLWRHYEAGNNKITDSKHMKHHWQNAHCCSLGLVE